MRPPAIWVAAHNLRQAKAFAEVDVGLRPHWWLYVSDSLFTLRGRRDAPLTTFFGPTSKTDRRYWDGVDEAVALGYARLLPDNWWAGLIFDHDHAPFRRNGFIGTKCAECGQRLNSHYSYGVETYEVLMFGHPLDYVLSAEVTR